MLTIRTIEQNGTKSRTPVTLSLLLVIILLYIGELGNFHSQIASRILFEPL